MAKRSDHGPGGKFAPGNQAARKRKAKHTGSRNRVSVMLDQMADAKAEDLMTAIQAKAINDDLLEAQIFLLERLWPKRKGGPPIAIDLPRILTADDVVEANARIIEAVTRGDLTAAEGQAVMELVNRGREAITLATVAAELAEVKALLLNREDSGDAS